MTSGSPQGPWPWLKAPLEAVLKASRAQALLVRGAPGVGTLEFSLTLAQAWLCESKTAAEAAEGRPCGRCESCRLVTAKTHPDLHVRLPEEMALALGWPHRYDDKRKPSRQIRMDDVREALDWMVTTPCRGVAKVLVMHPADAMNAVAASALLKTLEEPPALARIVLTAADPTRLLPTIVSRCQRWDLPTPPIDEAAQWLQSQGVSDAHLLLAATSGAPLEALRMFQDGLSGALWNEIPRAVARGDASIFDKWPVPRVVDALLKVCHDAVVHALAPNAGPDAEGAQRFFPAWKGPAASLQALDLWRAQLLRVARHADHPWQEALLLESLLAQAQTALTPPRVAG